MPVVSWLARVARALGATAALFALARAARGPYEAFVCAAASLPLPALLGGPGRLVAHAGAIHLSLGAVEREFDAPFLLVALPLYLGLACAAPRAVLRHPWRLLAGVGLVLLSQVLALDAIALRFGATSRPMLLAAEVVSLLLVSAQRVGPVLVWWLQFARGEWLPAVRPPEPRTAVARR